MPQYVSDVASELLRGLESSCNSVHLPRSLDIIYADACVPATPAYVLTCAALRGYAAAANSASSVDLRFIAEEVEEDADKVGSFAHAYP